MKSPFSRFWESERGLSIFLALIVLMVFVLPPLITPGLVARLALDAAFTLLLVAGIASVPASRPAHVALMSVAVFSIGLRLLHYLIASQQLDVYATAATALCTGLLTMVVLVQVFRRGAVTTHRVMGAVAAYLLLGLTWAFAYEFIAARAPSAFTGSGLGGGDRDFVYYSFVTLTTVGYGDIVPVDAGARSLAMLEALIGQLYPALLLARLVSLQVSETADR